ncbi:Disease resistance protein [Citrus sinensis]|nr:Disease resistance protein [Citrus sinensis]
MVESIVTSVLEFVKCLAPPTERRLGYLRNYKANVEKLKAEIDKLKDERRSIQHRVSEAERKGENIEEKVEKWLVSANIIIEQAAKFIDDEKTTNKRCLMGLCPNLKTRYQLSKKAETKVKAIVKLREEAGRFVDGISYRTIPEDIWLKSHKGYEAFDSRLSTLKAIQNALIDVDVSIIGVYGMGGIGKTTLVKEFARRAIEDKLYDMVVFSEVTQCPDIRKIQEEIAETLGLELSEEAESRRASRLYERLKNEKKILVILDNIWKPLDLGTIGIPFGVEHRGSTSVAKACGGLPIALTTVAKALRKKELPVWKNALQELQTPSEASFDEGVRAEAYSTIELSYKYLRDSIVNDIPEGSESLQLELLVMSPKNSFAVPNIPENLFKRTKKLRVLDLTRMRLLSLPSSIGLLVNLQTLCLNQSIFGGIDIAIIGKLENLEILSFLQSDIVELPKALGQLTKLRLLDLTDCFRLKVIAPNVISSLIRLEELYMGNCFIEWEVERANSKRSNASLDELMHLPRLTSLEIDVKSDNILPEGFLARKLERFKISIGNGLFMHPMSVGQHWFKSRPRFSINSDRKISRELELKLDFMDICSMKLQGINNVEYLRLDKLQGIENVLFNLDTEGFSQLKVLCIQNNPDFFCIVDSREMVACDAFPLLESLALHNLINMERICIDRLKVESFNKLKTIEAYSCNKLSNIFWLSTTKCLPRLERIAVINCSKMKEIFAVGEEVDNAIEKIEFAQLRSLSLGNLPEVTSFCREVETPSASPNRQVSQEESTTMYCSSEITLDISTLLFNEKLTTLILHDLPKLRCLYPGMHTSEWPALEILLVYRCDKLKIFAADLSQNNGNDQLGIPAQQPLLPLEKILPNLTELSLCGKYVKMILQADFPQHLFGSLKQLEIVGDDSACFPIWNVLERFHNLEMLVLCYFSFHEEVFSMEGCLEKHVGKLAMIKELELYRHYHLKQLCKQDSKLGPIFQYLEILRVYHCQSLLILLQSSSVSFGNLTKLVAFDCKKLIHLVTSSTAKTLVRLVSLCVYGCRAMTEVVINDKDGVEKEEIVSRKLKRLELRDLDSLTSFCSANYTFKFPSLQDLSVIGCPKFKIFTTGESSTPPRVNVWYGETSNQRRWASNDLNTTIQQLHAEKNVWILIEIQVTLLLYNIRNEAFFPPSIQILCCEGFPFPSSCDLLHRVATSMIVCVISEILVMQPKRGGELGY